MVHRWLAHTAKKDRFAPSAMSNALPVKRYSAITATSTGMTPTKNARSAGESLFPKTFVVIFVYSHLLQHCSWKYQFLVNCLTKSLQADLMPGVWVFLPRRLRRILLPRLLMCFGRIAETHQQRLRRVSEHCVWVLYRAAAVWTLC